MDQRIQKNETDDGQYDAEEEASVEDKGGNMLDPPRVFFTQ